MKIQLPAGHLAASWLNVSLASGDDEARPVLHKTVLFEVFDTGIQLVATDSFMLIGSFIPTAEDDLVNPPSDSEAPDHSYVVVDPDQRMRGLMRHMRKEAKAAAKTGEPCDVTVKFESAERAGIPTLDPSLDRVHCVVTAGSERLALPLFEGDYPDWRGVLGGEPDPAPSITFAPALIGRFGKLVDIDEGVKFTTTGAETICRFEIRDGESYMFGGLMPLRNF